jgi:hypothetical protein
MNENTCCKTCLKKEVCIHVCGYAMTIGCPVKKLCVPCKEYIKAPLPAPFTTRIVAV